jgi:GLPGLI family protein
MLKKIFLFFFIPFIQNASAQKQDTCLYRFSYFFEKYDSLTHKTTAKDSFVVESGYHSSVCYSSITRNNDTILAKYKKKFMEIYGDGKTKNINLTDYPIKAQGSTQIVYKEMAKNEIVVTDKVVTDKFFYHDSMELFSWQIAADTQTVEGYSCQKAECHFRGRDYTAWFTYQIPISNGPLKFGGLPGLICKLYDNTKRFTFSLISFEKANVKDLIVIDTTGFQKTTRKQLYIMRKAFFENPIGVINSQGNANITLTSGNSTSARKYDPLELE